jgi:hypothetical protein
MKLFIGEVPIKRVLEDFYGNLWFVKDQDGDDLFCYVRLYSMPQFAEWGHASYKEIVRAQKYGEDGVWDVTPPNWPNLVTYGVEGLRIDMEPEDVFQPAPNFPDPDAGVDRDFTDVPEDDRDEPPEMAP